MCAIIAWKWNEKGARSVIQRERRKSPRFFMRLPLTVRWNDENTGREALTETRDVSSSGLRFILPKGPKGGSTVEILITLPHQLTQAGPVRVHCHGRVVRTNLEGSGKTEVVAAIKRFQFTREAESVA